MGCSGALQTQGGSQGIPGATDDVRGKQDPVRGSTRSVTCQPHSAHTAIDGTAETRSFPQDEAQSEGQTWAEAGGSLCSLVSVW